MGSAPPWSRVERLRCTSGKEHMVEKTVFFTAAQPQSLTSLHSLRTTSAPCEEVRVEKRRKSRWTGEMCRAPERSKHFRIRNL